MAKKKQVEEHQDFATGRNRYMNFINNIPEEPENYPNQNSNQYNQQYPYPENNYQQPDYSQQQYPQMPATQENYEQQYAGQNNIEQQVFENQDVNNTYQESQNYQQQFYAQNEQSPNYQNEVSIDNNYSSQPNYSNVQAEYPQQNYVQPVYNTQEQPIYQPQMPQPQMQTTPHNAMEVRKQKEYIKERNTLYPTMGLRFKASLFDFVLGLTLAVVLFFQFLYETVVNTYNLYLSTGGKTILDLILNLRGKIISYIIFLLFIDLIFHFVVPVILKGQTIGKKICKIRIVSDFIDETDIPTPKQIFKREILGKWVGFLTLGLCFIPSKKKEFNKAFPDTIAETHIVFGNANQ